MYYLSNKKHKDICTDSQDCIIPYSSIDNLGLISMISNLSDSEVPFMLACSHKSPVCNSLRFIKLSQIAFTYCRIDSRGPLCRSCLTHNSQPILQSPGVVIHCIHNLLVFSYSSFCLSLNLCFQLIHLLKDNSLKLAFRRIAHP